MIAKNQYPVCEFDPKRDPVIHPANFLEKILPERCVITFFKKELEQFALEKSLPILGYLHSEVLDIPIYQYACGEQTLCVAMAFCGAPGAAVTLEELHAMGCKKFIVCGAAGALAKNSKVGELIVPVCALRDEGTSYHYIAPSREIECHQETAGRVISYLRQRGIPFQTGKTWTTDAIYRETLDLVELRRNEGCLTVEMEAAAFFAVSRYYGLPLAQLLYAGDDVSGGAWDSRDWNQQKSIRYNLLCLATEIAKIL